MRSGSVPTSHDESTRVWSEMDPLRNGTGGTGAAEYWSSHKTRLVSAVNRETSGHIVGYSSRIFRGPLQRPLQRPS